MMPMDEDPGLSPATVALLEALAAGIPPPLTRPQPDTRAVVRYLGSVLSSSEASRVEKAAAQDEATRHLLVAASRTVERLRSSPWAEVEQAAEGEGLEGEIARAWREVVAEPVGSLQEGLEAMVRRGAAGAHAAWTVLAVAAQNAFRTPPPAAWFTPVLRSGEANPTIEGEVPGGVKLTAEREGEQTVLTADVPEAVEESVVYVALEGTPRIRLAAIPFHDGRAALGLLPELPPEARLVVRFGEWPWEGDTPVAVLATEDSEERLGRLLRAPQIVEGNLRLALELTLPGPSTLEVAFATGPEEWQLLGAWPLAADDTGFVEVSLPAPGPEGPFVRPLRVLRTATP